MQESFRETRFFSANTPETEKETDALFYEKEYITKEELETFVGGLETRIREQMKEAQTESSRLSLILHVFTEEMLRMETIEKEFPDYRVRTQALGENHFSMRYKPTAPIPKEGEVMDQSLYEPVHISKNDPEILQALRQLRLSVLESLKHRFREEQWED